MSIVILKNGKPIDRKRKHTWVYAARVVADGTIKIGVSGNLDLRMKTIRAEKKSAIELIGVIPGALVDEKRIHKILKTSQHAFEYYRETPEVTAFINKYLSPPEQYGLNVECNSKPYRLMPVPLRNRLPNPDSVNRYIDKILQHEGNQKIVMIRRLLMRIAWMTRSEFWPTFQEILANRLDVDLLKSTKGGYWQRGYIHYFNKEPQKMIVHAA